MAPADGRRRLIVNADDFGRSHSINAAVIQAHQRGILTSASLMVNGAAAEEAAGLARANPGLGVGLHLTLCCGEAALPPAEIPALVNCQGRFRDSAVGAGWVYFFSPAARRQLAAEMAAQFAKFSRTGLPLDHVNGHLHFHLHPAVFSLLKPLLAASGFPPVRLTHDPVRIDWPLGSGRWIYRASHALMFRVLAGRARPFLLQNCAPATRYVFGLLENGRVSEEYLLKLLARLPEGDSELYSHPSLDEFQHEYAALISPAVRRAIEDGGIELTRYQDLWRNSSSSSLSLSALKPPGLFS